MPSGNPGYFERVDPDPRTGELFGNEPGSSFVLIAQPLAQEDPTLPRKFGSLTVLVTPKDTNVEIEWANLPAKGFLRTLSVERVEPGKPRYHLPVGDYTIRAARTGYTPAGLDVAIEAGTKTIRIDMERQ